MCQQLALSIKHNFSFNQTQLFFHPNTNQSNTSSSKIPKLNSSLYPQNLSLPHPPPKKDYHNTHKEPLFSFSQGWTVVGNNFYHHSCWQTLPFSLGWTQNSTLWQSYTGHLTHTLPLIFICLPLFLRDLVSRFLGLKTAIMALLHKERSHEGLNLNYIKRRPCQLLLTQPH